MDSKDIRWKQRFDHFSTALKQLTEAVNTAKQRPLSNLEKQGLIQVFEFTHELAWNVLKDYLEHTGGQILIGSKDTSREACQKNLISDGEAWMGMIKSRNLSSHTYNQETADLIQVNIIGSYYPCFISLHKKKSSLLP